MRPGSDFTKKRAWLVAALLGAVMVTIFAIFASGDKRVQVTWLRDGYEVRPLAITRGTNHSHPSEAKLRLKRILASLRISRSAIESRSLITKSPSEVCWLHVNWPADVDAGTAKLTLVSVLPSGETMTNRIESLGFSSLFVTPFHLQPPRSMTVQVGTQIVATMQVK